MERFLIQLYTAWCGEEQTYSAIAEDEDELQDIAQLASYDNFVDFDGLQQIMEDEDIDEDDAMEIEGDYYGFTIEEWDWNRPEEEWGWYEMIYDGSKLISDATV